MTLRDKIANYFTIDGGDVVAVYLFGSHAAGKSRKGSDVDIGILFAAENPDLISKRINEIIIDLPRLLRKDVHPVAMNRAGEGLLKQIFGKGECILVHDRKKLAHFKMVAYSKIANFSYYRNRMQNGLIRNIMEN
ncbi:MAG: nucleotidyltransferase domain-containing protein [Desulfobacterales bacterium]|jgi:predicted nucleotidyltransferase